MPGKVKTKYVGELMKFEKSFKRPLNFIAEILPQKYDNEDILEDFESFVL